jgi:predicted phage terminase large subunit-like protein
VAANREDLINLLREDFRFFLVWAFHVLNPGLVFQDNWHIDAIAHHLMKVSRGEILRLLITMPPRSLKSHSISVAYTAWELGRNPSTKFIDASYGEKLSELLAQQTRKLMQNPEYRAAFPHMVFADNSPLDMMKTTSHGYRCATSVGGAVTGIGADCVIADDLLKASASPLEREKAIEFYKSSLLSRLNNKNTGRAIVVAQRIALDDLPGYLIDQGGYTHLNLQAIASTTEDIEIGPAKWKRFEAGAYLHENREGKETLDRARRDLGDEHFAAQYLQKPNGAQGAMLDPMWFPPYEQARPLRRYPLRILSIDTALSTATTANYSAASIFGGDGKIFDLLHVWRNRVGFENLVKMTYRLISEFEITHVMVERSAAGFALLEDLERKYAYGVVPIFAKLDKEKRVERAIPFFRDRRIRLPLKAPWLTDLKSEIFSFPNTMYDDQLDTVVQFAWFADSFADRDPLTIRGSEADRGGFFITGMNEGETLW